MNLDLMVRSKKFNKSNRFKLPRKIKKPLSHYCEGWYDCAVPFFKNGTPIKWKKKFYNVLDKAFSIIDTDGYELLDTMLNYCFKHQKHYEKQLKLWKERNNQRNILSPKK